jgi:acyl carrier protein
MPGAAEQSAAGGTDAEVRVLEIVAAVAAELRPGREARTARLDSRLDQDLGFDSLGRVELVSRLDAAFGVALAERVAIEAETPGDLLEAIRSAPPRRTPTPPTRARRADAPSAHGTIRVPESARNWLDVLDHHLEHRPDEVSIRFHADAGPEPVLTYRDLVRDAAAVAGAFVERGIEPGAAVALMLPTGPDYFRCFAGIWLAGAVPVPIYPPFRPSHLEEHARRQVGILTNCEAAFLVTTADLAPVARLLRDHVPSLAGILTPDRLDGRPPPRPAVASDATALLQYTSGSTAAPKGVVLSHANLLANVRAIGTAVEVRPDDVTAVSYTHLTLPTKA